MYDKKVKLIITSVVELNELFIDFENKSTEEIFLTYRCLSRLIEIQTKGYLNLPHSRLILSLIHI